MKQQLHFFTLATVDLDATREFYTALGWTPTLDVPGEIIFYQSAPGQLLGFFLAEKFNEDLAQAADHSQVSGITLAHNVDSQDEVVELAAPDMARTPRRAAVARAQFGAEKALQGRHRVAAGQDQGDARGQQVGEPEPRRVVRAAGVDAVQPVVLDQPHAAAGATAAIAQAGQDVLSALDNGHGLRRDVSVFGHGERLRRQG